MTNRATQFTTRSKSAVRKFRLGGIDYESTMDLLTEHAHRVSGLNPRVVTHAQQAVALDEIYSLIEWVQAREVATVPAEVLEMIDLGDGNYVTPQRHVEY
jgi:hypothetical protein